MIDISFEIDENKIFDIDLQKYVNMTKLELESKLKSFDSIAQNIAIDRIRKADSVASERLIDNFNTDVGDISGGIAFFLTNDAVSPSYGGKSYHVYYWNIIDAGRRGDENNPPRQPPTQAILDWMKAKPVRFRQPRSTTRKKKERFIKQNRKGQAFAIAKSISQKGIIGRPHIFNDIRNDIYDALIRYLQTG